MELINLPTLESLLIGAVRLAKFLPTFSSNGFLGETSINGADIVNPASANVARGEGGGIKSSDSSMTWKYIVKQIMITMDVSLTLKRILPLQLFWWGF